MPLFYEHLDTVFAWVLRSTAQASVLALLIFAVQFALRKRLPARWQYILWFVLLVRIALPWAPESPSSMFNAERLFRTTTIAPNTPIAPISPITPITISPEASNSDEPLPTESTPSTTSTTSTPSPQPLPAASSAPPTSSISFPAPPRESLPALAWALGAVGLALYAAARNLSLWTHIRRQRPVTDPQRLDLLEECKDCMGVRTPVTLVESSRLGTPALVGFIRPRLVLPANSGQTLSTEELRFIFLHELAHLKRNDILVNWFMLALQVLHWFNPIIWLAFRRMLADREAACDALALSRAGAEHAQNYGLTILRLLDRTPRLIIIPGAAGILEDKSQLKRRITLISQFTPNAYRWSSMALAALAILAIVGLTNPTRAADTTETPLSAAAIVPAAPAPKPPHAKGQILPQYACEFVFFEVSPDAPLPTKDLMLLPEGANLSELARKALGGDGSDSPRYRIMASPSVVMLAGKPANMRVGQKVPVTRFEPASNGNNDVKTVWKQQPIGVEATVTVGQGDSQGPLEMDLKLEISRVLDLNSSEHDSTRDTSRAIESRTFDGHFAVTPGRGQLLIFRSENASAIVVAELISPEESETKVNQPAPSTFESMVKTLKSAFDNPLPSKPSSAATPIATQEDPDKINDNLPGPVVTMLEKIARLEAKKKAVEKELNDSASADQPTFREATALQQTLDRQVELAERQLETKKKMHEEGLAPDGELDEGETKVQRAKEKAATAKLAQLKDLLAVQAPLREKLSRIDNELEELRDAIAPYNIKKSPAISAELDALQSEGDSESRKKPLASETESELKTLELRTPREKADELKTIDQKELGPKEDSSPQPREKQAPDDAQLRAACQTNLKQLGLVLKMFDADHKGMMPALASKPGQLMFNANDVFPQYITDAMILVCPSRQDQVPENIRDNSAPNSVLINDRDYIYLGYAVTTEEEGLAFVQAYRDILKGPAQTGFENDINVSTKVTETTANTRIFCRLREGVERFLITDINDPSPSNRARATQSAIPAIIERPGHHEPNGGHVLFMDGHVEYLKYPGKFPMTEKFIQALLELDKLKTSASEKIVGEIPILKQADTAPTQDSANNTLMKDKAVLDDAVPPKQKSTNQAPDVSLKSPPPYDF